IFDAFGEQSFDSLDDLNALYTCEAFQEVVDPDHANFIDLASVSRIVSEEIVVVG
ncbi:ethyl tert-butyl ether degradation protein EthD, partial [Sphingomonas sanguinis]